MTELLNNKKRNLIILEVKMQVRAEVLLHHSLLGDSVQLSSSHPQPLLLGINWKAWRRRHLAVVVRGVDAGLQDVQQRVDQAFTAAQLAPRLLPRRAQVPDTQTHTGGSDGAAVRGFPHRVARNLPGYRRGESRPSNRSGRRTTAQQHWTPTMHFYTINLQLHISVNEGKSCRLQRMEFTLCEIHFS